MTTTHALFSVVLISLLWPGEPLLAADNYFYSGGKRNVLTPAPDWIGAAAAPDQAGMVTKRVADAGFLREAVSAVTHDEKGITVLPVTAGQTGKANASLTAAGLRTVRVFRNGNVDPIVETDDLIVCFKPEVQRAQAEAMLAARGAVIVRAMGNFAPNAFLARMTNGQSSIDAANRLYETAGVAWAHPDLIWPMVPRYSPNDPMYAQQWHLNNPGGSGGTPGADIKAERAWEFTRGSSSIIIAIVDDGVETTHEDFAGRIVAGWDFVGNDNDARPGAGQNHGTACAGLAAAAGNNSIGVSGVAPECSIMPIRLLGPGGTFSRQAAAITWAKDNGAHIISNSWGPTDGLGVSQPCPDVVSTAITDASETGRGGKGCIITWAAGNGNESADLDGYASHPRVLCIGATLRNDTRSPYSDSGAAVDLCAPGGSQAGDMVTVDRMGAAGYNNTSNYTTGFNGTSAATPVVSGAIALLLSAEPELTRDQVNQRMINGTEHIDTANATYDANGRHNNYGFGRINIWRTLGWNDNSPPVVGIANITEGQVFSSLSTATGGITETGSGLYRVRGTVRNRTTNKWWKQSVGAWVDVEAEARQESASPAWGILLPPGEGSFELRVQAEDKAGNFSAVASVNYAVDNTSPGLTIEQPGSGTLASSPGAVSGTATDAGTGVKEIRVALRDAGAGRWWSWTGNAWGGAEFVWAQNTGIATGTTAWSRALPVLAEGSYEVYVQALDNNDAASEWKSRSFVFDSGNPAITFTLAEQSQVFDFTVLGGTISEPGTVTWKLTEFNVGGTDRYWTGSAWTTDAASTALWRPADTSGGHWQPGEPVPGRLSTRSGHYLAAAKIVDRGGRTTETSVVLIRSATDATLPDLFFSSPAPGAIVTTNSLPQLSGIAGDPQSGIASLGGYLMRQESGSFYYWNGRVWTLTPTVLPLQHHQGTGFWQAPLTTGLNAWSLPGDRDLVNGAYQLQVTATNGELPAGTRTETLSFTVDYHPIYTWTAGSLSDFDPNNNDIYWGNPDNWSPYGIPGPGDIVVLESGTVRSTVSRTVYALRMSGGMLEFTNGPGADGTLTTTNASTWTGGTMTGIWENPGIVTVSGAGPKALWDDAVINNHGTIIWNGDGPIRARAAGGAGAIINNKPGAVFRIAGAGEVFTREYGNRRPVFNNENGARLERDGSGGFATLTIWEFQNAGEIRAQTGILTFLDGPYDGYDLFLNPGTTLTGAAYLRINNGTQLNTAVHAQCSVEMVDGSWLGCPGAPGVAKFEGTLNWWGGFIFGNLTIGSAGVLNATDIIPATPVVKQLWDDTTLDNDGIINWTGGAPIRARAAGGAGAVINNRSGGIFNLTADGTVFAREYGNRVPVFNNLAGGIFRKTAGTGNTAVDTFAFNHRGGMVCDAGTMSFFTAFDVASTVPWTGAGDFELHGGELTITGALHLNGPSFTILNGNVWGAADGSGAFTTTGGSTVEWKGGTFLRTLKLTAGSALNLSGPDPKVLWDDAVLDNDGTITWQGGGPLRARAAGGSGAVVNNRSGARFEAAADGEVFTREYGNRTPVFNNLAGATLARTAGSGTATVHTFQINNDSIITAQTGVLAFNTVLNLNNGGTLNGAGRFEMPGGVVNVTGGTSLGGTSFSVLAGDIVGLAAASWTSTAGGVWRWLGGALSGTLEISANSTLQIADPAAATAVKVIANDAVLNNRGTIEWSGAGPIRAQASGGTGSIIANKSGSVFRALSDGPLLTREYTNRMPRFMVESGAQWQKPSGDGAVLTTCDWSFENAGSVSIGGGTVDLLQGGDSSGSFTATGGGVLRFRGGTHTLRSGVVLSGNGRIQVDGGTVNGEGALYGNATAPGAFELLSGFLGGTVNYSGAGLFHWSGGSLAGVLTLAVGTRADLDGTAVKYMWDDAVLNNSGTVTWLGSGAIQARAAGGTGAIIDNQSGGIFRIAADGDVFSREYGNRRPVFYNRNGGRFEKSGGGGASTCGVWEFHSAGEMRCGTGTFSFVDGPYDGYDLYLEPGASLTGTGRLRLQTATHLTTAIHAQGPVDLPEPSWLGCPPPAEGSAPSRFEGLLNWTGGVVWGELVIGPAGIVEVNDAVPGTPVVKQLWDDTTLHNEGLIRWLGGAPIRARAAGGAGAVINNRAGAFFHTAADGVVFAREYGNRLPVFNNLAGGTFRKTGGTGNTAVDTFAFNHRGGMVCDSGTISFFTALDVASATPWTGAGDFELHGGDLTITGVLQMNGPSFTIRDGTVWGATDGSGAFGTAAGGSIEWQGGAFLRTLRLTAGSTMNLTGPAVKALWDDTVLENDGSIIWHGGGPLRARAAGGTGAILNNRAGSVFHAAASGAVLTREYGNRVPVLLNAGTLRLGLPIASCSFDGWSFTQINGGGLQVDVAGIAAGEFDSLSVNNGAATLAGTLSAANINGYAPATGTTFPFLTAGTVTGTFANVTGGFSAEYTGTTATLRAGAAALTFNDWAASKGLTGANALPSADPDHDGYNNFFEYVHNMNPAAAGGAPLSAETVTVGPQQFLTLNYRIWADREAAGVTYTPQAGSLTNWGTAGIINEVDATAPVIPGSTAWKARVPIVAGEGKFLRLKAVRP